MNRERLPDRRETTTFEIAHKGHRYVVARSSFADGRVGEVFIDPVKRGSELGEMMRDAAVITSIALQHGAPLATLIGALSRDGEGSAPASPIGAIIDALRDQTP